MKAVIVCALSILPLLGSAQKTKPGIDSSRYYRNELRLLWQRNYDSMRKSDEYLSIMQKLEKRKKKTTGYTGLMIFGDYIHSDFSKFNSSISANGFNPMNPTTFRFGIGVSNKTERVLFDVYFFSLGFEHVSAKGDESIGASLSNVLQFDIGYDIVQAKALSFYVFSGLSGRISSINYSKKAQTNSSFTNITNIVVNNVDVNASSVRLGVQFGAGIDVLLGERRNKSGATYLFTKFGSNRPVWADRYKIEGFKYNPGIKQGDWLVTVGLKFGTWR